MNGDEMGIWVRTTLMDGVEVTGFASGAESPNDFWSKFRTQMVRLTHAREVPPRGEVREHETIYVNRDQIGLVEVLPPPE